MRKKKLYSLMLLFISRSFDYWQIFRIAAFSRIKRKVISIGGIAVRTLSHFHAKFYHRFLRVTEMRQIHTVGTGILQLKRISLDEIYTSKPAIRLCLVLLLLMNPLDLFQFPMYI